MNSIEEHSSQYNITDEILQSLANMSNPKVNQQDQEQKRNHARDCNQCGEVNRRFC